MHRCTHREYCGSDCGHVSGPMATSSVMLPAVTACHCCITSGRLNCMIGAYYYSILSHVSCTSCVFLHTTKAQDLSRKHGRDFLIQRRLCREQWCFKSLNLYSIIYSSNEGRISRVLLVTGYCAQNGHLVFVPEATIKFRVLLVAQPCNFFLVK